MPTGYTADVQDGKITEFADFAMACARAFGACITLRDEHHSTPIPEQFEPSDYNARRLVEVTAKLVEIESLSPTERQAAADAENERDAKSWDDAEQKRHEQRFRYEAMLEKARAWSPPTPEHEGMKQFMINQLVQSIDFDCGKQYRERPQPKSVDDWYAEAILQANKDIAYNAKAQADEIDRARKRTKWVADLRASLVTDHRDPSSPRDRE